MARTTLVLVSCSAKKAGSPEPARDLYISPLFRLSRQYAERVGDAWAVLSARYGLVWPHTLATPYDRRLEQLGPRELEDWRDDVHREASLWMAAEGVGRRELRLIVLAGRRYVEALPQWLLELAEQPLAGMGIGERLGWLKRQNTRTTC